MRVKVLAETQLVLNCPYCNAIFEVTPPDSWHFESSLEEPLMSEVYGEVKKQELVCKNSKCRKSITVYWYAPIEYLHIM